MIRSDCARTAPWLAGACLLLALSHAAAFAGCGDSQSPQPAPQDARVYRVVPGESEIRILVYRDGPLARFGHNHVIRATAMEGVVHQGDSVEDSAFRLAIPVHELEVDPADVRAEEGSAFDSELSEGDVRDTRANMLGESVLDGANHPEIRVRSVSMTGSPTSPEARLRIRVREDSRDLTVPVTVYESGQRLVMLASFTLRQSDLGIEPFSVLGGGLRVQDEVRIRARIVARPDSGGG